MFEHFAQAGIDIGQHFLHGEGLLKEVFDGDGKEFHLIAGGILAKEAGDATVHFFDLAAGQLVPTLQEAGFQEVFLTVEDLVLKMQGVGHLVEAEVHAVGGVNVAFYKSAPAQDNDAHVGIYFSPVVLLVDGAVVVVWVDYDALEVLEDDRGQPKAELDGTGGDEGFHLGSDLRQVAGQELLVVNKGLYPCFKADFVFRRKSLVVIKVLLKDLFVLWPDPSQKGGTVSEVETVTIHVVLDQCYSQHGEQDDVDRYFCKKHRPY